MTQALYDVAISYASDDIAIADVIASRLRQDGFRCYYNPNRLHKLLGLEIGPALEAIYGHPDIFVIAIISPISLTKDYPRRELAAAIGKGGDKLIPVRVANATLPDALQTRSYADHDKFGTEAIAIQVSNAVAEKIGRPESVARPRITFEPSMRVLDHPPFPYLLENVEFCDTGQEYIVDIHSTGLELPSPLHYVTRTDAEAPAAPFSTVSARDIAAAKGETCALIERKKASGWPIFNGRKYGVASLQRTRTPEAERHRLIVHVYETDYVTSQFAKRLYRRLKPTDDVALELSHDWSSYSGLLASFGFDILLLAPSAEGPRLLLSRRSGNVANAETSGGRWHVSMNEGVSKSDRYSPDFDASATVYRGFAEELNLHRVDLRRIDLHEPFLELDNFEIGISGVAYTAMDIEEIKPLARQAADSLLETATFHDIEASASAIRAFLAASGGECTNLLRFGLQSLLSHDVAA
jgi:hypothetical protein